MPEGTSRWTEAPLALKVVDSIKGRGEVIVEPVADSADTLDSGCDGLMEVVARDVPTMAAINATSGLLAHGLTGGNIPALPPGLRPPASVSAKHISTPF